MKTLREYINLIEDANTTINPKITAELADIVWSYGDHLIDVSDSGDLPDEGDKEWYHEDGEELQMSADFLKRGNIKGAQTYFAKGFWRDQIRTEIEESADYDQTTRDLLLKAYDQIFGR